MQVRRWAVVGSLVAAVRAAGSGLAQATDGETAPPACQLQAAAGEGEGTPAIEDCPQPDPYLDDQVDVSITGNCAEPEVFSFTIAASGLDGHTTCEILFVTDGSFVFDSGDGFPGYHISFTTNATGAYSGTVTALRVASPLRARASPWPMRCSMTSTCKRSSTRSPAARPRATAASPSWSTVASRSRRC